MKKGQSFLGWLQHDAKYIPHHIKRGIKNLIKWFPIVWEDADWDHSYIMYALRFKIKNTADYIEKHKRFEDWERDVQRMRLCVRLIDALEQDIYELEYQDYYETIFNWEKEEKGLSKLNSNVVKDDLDKYLAKYPNYIRKLNIIPEKGNNISAALTLGRYRNQRAHDLLFEIIKRHINEWWD